MAKLEIGLKENGSNDFLNGMTTSADTSDGGFSSESYNVNPIINKGLLRSGAALADASTNLVDEVIATCEDPNYNGKGRIVLDDSGNFYWCDSSTFALTLKATASSDKFDLGTTDLVAWHDSSGGINFYATTKAGSSGDIVKYNRETTLTETWWTGAGTLNQAALSELTPWRPLLSYNTFLYVGDANKLHRISPGLVVSNSIMTLPQTESISAMAVEPSSGYMLIATASAADYSARRNGSSKLYLYDGYSNKPAKEIPVTGTITAIVNGHDRTYIFYGNKLGYFTGSGIQYLRTLSFSIGTSTDLVYKHKATRIENTLYFADKEKIMAYGESEPGKKVFFYPGINPLSSNSLTCVTALTGSTLGVSFSSAKFYTLDTDSVATSSGINFYSRKFNFSQDIQCEKIEIEVASSVTQNNIWGTAYVIDETGTSYSLGDIQNTSAAFFMKTFSFDRKVRTFQLRITTTANYQQAFKRAVLTYKKIDA